MDEINRATNLSEDHARNVPKRVLEIQLLSSGQARRLVCSKGHGKVMSQPNNNAWETMKVEVCRKVEMGRVPVPKLKHFRRYTSRRRPRK